MAVTSVIPIALSDISSDILYEKSAAYASIGLLKTMTECNGGIMVKLSERGLKMLVKGGETNTAALCVSVMVFPAKSPGSEESNFSVFCYHFKLLL